MIEPCGNQAEHPAHHYIAADWNGYLCEGVSRAETLERQLAATVDELTEAQTENERLNAYLIDAFNQRDEAQAAREQAEAQRDRALEQAGALHLICAERSPFLADSICVRAPGHSGKHLSSVLAEERETGS